MLRVLNVLALVLAVALAGTPLCRCLSGSSAQRATDEHGCCSTGGDAQLTGALCCGALSATLPTTASLEQPTSVAPTLALIDVAPEPAVPASAAPCETSPRLAPSRSSPILRI
jgi:hypothetical protein